MLHTPRMPIGDLSDPGSLSYYLKFYLAFLEERSYSAHTVYSFGLGIRTFLRWCDERGLSRPEELNRTIMEGYQRHLFYYRKANGDPLTESSQHTRLIPVKLWLKWLVKRGHLPASPAADLELPRRGVHLPKAILTAKETELVLAVPDINTPLGLRDRAILETFYSTGMRRMELMGLRLPDLDRERGTVMIRQGKGRKDRVIPIGERALAWIAAYLDRVRPDLVAAEDTGTLFLTLQGKRLKMTGLSRLVSEYVNKAGIEKKGSCHLFRHTAATLMHENGADIRDIQAMLGHVRLETSQIYTRVSIQHLKAIHTATHPGKLAKVGLHPFDEGGNPAVD